MMEFLAGFLCGIDVHDDGREIRQLMRQAVPYLFGNGVAFGNRQIGRHGDVQLGPQALARPPGANVGHLCDAGNMSGRVANLVDSAWFDTVQQPREQDLVGVRMVTVVGVTMISRFVHVNP
jgi:hypothetical protein